jgi:hypothetical protein
MASSPIIRFLTIGTALCLAVGFVIYARREAVAVQQVTSGANSPSHPETPAGTPRPAFAFQNQPQIGWRVPGGNGTAVASHGQYCLNAVRVAVPDQFNNIRYLPGSDPAAIAYLARKHAEQQSLTVDNGPANANTNALPPQNLFSNSSKQVGIKPGG